MAYQSKYTGQQIDDAVGQVQSWKSNPASIVTKDAVESALTSEVILSKLTGQQIIDKINSVTGNITFTKYVDAQAGAGNSNA